jgi:hypothetical protein
LRPDDIEASNKGFLNRITFDPSVEVASGKNVTLILFLSAFLNPCISLSILLLSFLFTYRHPASMVKCPRNDVAFVSSEVTKDVGKTEEIMRASK